MTNESEIGEDFERVMTFTQTRHVVRSEIKSPGLWECIVHCMSPRITFQQSSADSVHISPFFPGCSSAVFGFVPAPPPLTLNWTTTTTKNKAWCWSGCCALGSCWDNTYCVLMGVTLELCCGVLWACFGNSTRRLALGNLECSQHAIKHLCFL